MEEPNGDELAPNVSPPARSNRVVFGALTVFVLAAVGLVVVIGYVAFKGSDPSVVLYQFQSAVVRDPQPITGNTVTFVTTWCNETNTPLGATFEVTWVRLDVREVVILGGGLTKFDSGCNDIVATSAIPEQIKDGTWIRTGSVTYEYKGKIQVAQFRTEEFTVAR